MRREDKTQLLKNKLFKKKIEVISAPVACHLKQKD
jgi:hypothetical protein